MNEFNLNKTSDGTKSITINYLPLGLKDILFNDSDKNITATCELSSSSNVTFVENNVTTEYKAKRIYIVGNANDTKVNMISGVTTNGQLIIRNTNANGDKILYTCFPLMVTNPGPRNSGIDSIIRTATSGTTKTSLTVDFNADIFAKEVPDLKYLEYTSNLGNSAKVITFGAPISIISVYLMTLENNTNLFNLQPDNYSLISPPVPGEWMECDYVPIDSEEVETYNLPVSSSLVQDSAAHNSLKTMFMYILFLIFTGLSYSLIPLVYKYILKLIFDFSGTIIRNEQIKKMGYFDFFMRVALIATTVIFFMLGQQFILYGVVIAIATLLGYIIITSKKAMLTNWPIDELEREKR
jgi:hypothetical protein